MEIEYIMYTQRGYQYLKTVVFFLLLLCTASK